MAVAGIYDLRSHRDEVVMPVLRYWKIFEPRGAVAGGEQRGPSLSNFMDGLDKQAARFEDKRDTLKSRMNITRAVRPA